MQYDVSLSDYDEMTPHELNMFIEGKTSRIEMENEYKLQLAYMTAYWHRVETLKPFNEEIGKTKQEEVKDVTKEGMSSMDMFLKIHELNAKMGGIVKSENDK